MEPANVNDEGIIQERIVNSKELEKSLPRLMCAICLNILWKPSSCSKCQTLFCDFCIQRWTIKSPLCPNRCQYIKAIAPPIVKNYLSDILIMCRYANTGCKHVIGYDELEKHEMSCLFREKKCRGCGNFYLLSVLFEHEKNCDLTKVSCRSCNEEFSKQKIIIHDEFNCLFVKYNALLVKYELLENEKINLNKQKEEIKLDLFDEKKEIDIDLFNEKAKNQQDSKFIPVSFKMETAKRISTFNQLIINQIVYFNISIDGKPSGKLIFELYSKDVPKTAENFRALCTGEKRGKSGERLNYQGSTFHRIMIDFMCQGGDFVNGNGTGGMSIYGAKFDDENFMYKHNDLGILSMANTGKNTNRSQFFITFTHCPWLDGKHVVFGRLKSGFDLLNLIKNQASASGKPKGSIIIADCGQLE